MNAEAWTRLSCAITQPAAASASAGGVAARRMAWKRRMKRMPAPESAPASVRCGIVVLRSSAGSICSDDSSRVRSAAARGLKRRGRSSDGCSGRLRGGSGGVAARTAASGAHRSARGAAGRVGASARGARSMADADIALLASAGAARYALRIRAVASKAVAARAKMR
jgi:hypothetical protein